MAEYTIDKFTYDSNTYNLRDKNTGIPEAPYKQVEWVESDGRQFIYLDWKPSAGWGFEADFITYNAFSTTAGAVSTANKNGYGTIFGTRNASGTKAFYLSTYSTNGYFYTGSNVYQTAGQLKTDKTRQLVKLHGTTYTKPDGTTMTVTNTGTAPNWNMCVFALTNMATFFATYANNDSITQYGTVRIYSLKFYDSGDVLVVDLVGAYRKSDNCPGLYDKVSKHFYPAIGLSVGSDVGDLGEPLTVENNFQKTTQQVISTQAASSKIWKANANNIIRLEDGQQILFRNRFGTASDDQTSTLVNRNDASTSYSNVYIQLTLANGTVTDYIPCYYGPATRLTSHYGAGSEIRFVYRENVMCGTYAMPRGFWADANYVDGNTIDRVRESYFRPYAGEALYRYKFVLQGADNRVYPVVVTDQTDATQVAKVPTQVGLRPGRIWYYNTTTTISAGALIGANTLDKVQQTTISVYNFNTDIAAYRMVYLRGTYNKTTDLFTLYKDDSSPCTSYYTQVPTNTANITLSSYFTSGYYYMLLGASYSSANYIALFAYNPLYYFDGTNLIPASTKVANDLNTDTKVTQTESTTDANYEVLFAKTTGTAERTDGVSKSTNMDFNPNTGFLNVYGGINTTLLNAMDVITNSFTVIDETSGHTGMIIPLGIGLSDDYIYELPDQSGTIALTSDIPSTATYGISGSLSNHAFTSTLTAGGTGTTSVLTLAAGTGITITDDTTNKKMTIACSVTNTDTKVTAVGNHYTPSGGTTTSASGATGTSGTTVQVVTGVTKDAAGHVTGITSGAATDTTYQSKAAASGGTAVSLCTTGEKYTWNNKQAALVSGTNIKTVNNQSLLGSGNITVQSGSSATATLTANSWTNGTQTVTVQGVTSSNNVIISPAPASYTAYTSAGVYCNAQGTNSLTFTCVTTPTVAMTVNVLILG